MFFSIIVAVYNGKNVLSAMVDSILAQTYEDFELVLVDDGSTDGSAALCDGYAEQDARVRVVHKQNGGLCSCRNLGIETAKAKWILFPDQDDRMVPNMLQRLAQAIATDAESADFYITGYRVRVENSKGEAVELRDVVPAPGLLASPSQIREYYLEHIGDGTVAPVWSMAFSVPFLRGSGLMFNENLRMSLDDLDFHIDSFFVAQRVRAMDGVGIEYYVRQIQSSSRKYNEVFADQCAERLGKLRHNMLTYGMDNDKSLLYYHQYAFRMFTLSCIQNEVYSRGQHTKHAIMVGIMRVCEDSITKEAVKALGQRELLSPYLLKIHTSIKNKNYNLIYRIFAFKQWISHTRLFALAKRIVSYGRRKVEGSWS